MGLSSFVVVSRRQTTIQVNFVDLYGSRVYVIRSSFLSSSGWFRIRMLSCARASELGRDDAFWLELRRRCGETGETQKGERGKNRSRH